MTKVQVGCKYVNYEEGVVKIFHMFLRRKFGFDNRFSNCGLVHKCGFFTEKTTYFSVVNSVKEMNNEISRKHENMRAISRSKRT